MGGLSEPISSAQIDALIEVSQKLHRQAGGGGNGNHVSTVLNLGGAGLLLGALIGVLGVWAAIDARREARADARIMAAERKADMAQLSALMSRVEGVESQVRADRILITKAEQRIATLEPK